MDFLSDLISAGGAAVQRGNLAEAARIGSELKQFNISQNAAALYLLGTVDLLRGDPASAVPFLKSANELSRGNHDVLTKLGAAHIMRSEWAEAEAAFREVVQLRPVSGLALNGLGISLSELGRLDEAIAMFQKDIELRPSMTETFSNLASALNKKGDLPGALTASEQALRIQPKNVEARKCRSLSWFLLGRYAQAWPEYELRWSRAIPLPPIPQPQWDGSDLHGQSILLYGEQGLGDAIQFIRYAALVKDRGGRVIFACVPKLHAILASCRSIDEIVDLHGPYPQFDVWIPLLSLPRIFGTTLETVPADVPYLFADRDRVERWAGELSAIPGFRIGICWRGKPSYRSDRQRSIPLAQFAPLARLPDVRLISLQRDVNPGEIHDAGFPVIEWNGLDADAAFLDTAAVMMNLDLVITCDTSVGHLAGALGVPVWEAQNHVPDWRWVMGAETTPWYPTMRLFQQRTLGDWPEVFARLAAALPAMQRS